MTNLIHSPSRALRSPVRNRYFWGKLLDAEHLELEQRYHNEKRWLLNRHAHGKGVLCGLAVEPADGNRLWIRPGVALDGVGREIVVPESFCLEHPAQPTDACGMPVGDPVLDATVWICLAYHECDIEPVRALVDGCDPRDACRANAVRERFRVLVHAGEPPVPDTVIDGVLDDAVGSIVAAPGAHAGTRDVFLGSAGGEQGAHANPVLRRAEQILLASRRRLCQVWAPACGPAPLECVPIAQVKVDGNGDLKPESCTLRRQIPSNADLLDGLFLATYFMSTQLGALESQVADLQRRLRYEAGDAQSAGTDTVLTDSIAVVALGAGGTPLPNVEVHFRIMGGGGGLGDPGSPAGAEHTVTTSADGTAMAGWRLGKKAGLNSAEALLGSGPARIDFHALAV